MVDNLVTQIEYGMNQTFVCQVIGCFYVNINNSERTKTKATIAQMHFLLTAWALICGAAVAVATNGANVDEIIVHDLRYSFGRFRCPFTLHNKNDTLPMGLLLDGPHDNCKNGCPFVTGQHANGPNVTFKLVPGFALKATAGNMRLFLVYNYTSNSINLVNIKHGLVLTKKIRLISALLRKSLKVSITVARSKYWWWPSLVIEKNYTGSPRITFANEISEKTELVLYQHPIGNCSSGIEEHRVTG